MTIISSKNQSETAMQELVKQVRAHGSTNQHAGTAHAENLSRYATATQPTQQEKVEKQVRTWVGQSFYGTLLKQMRDDPFKSKLFDGGRGGEAFGQMFDTKLAEHMANGVGTKIVRPMVKSMMGAAAKKNAQRAYRKQNTPTTQEQSDVSTDRRA